MKQTIFSRFLIIVGLILPSMAIIWSQQGPPPGGPPGGGPGGPPGSRPNGPPPGGREGGGSAAAPLGKEVPDVSTGTVTTNIDPDVPAWIRENFTGIRAFMKGDMVVIQTRGLPPYKTYYYGSTGKYAARYDGVNRPKDPNPNTLSELSITLTVPAKPTLASPDLKSTAIKSNFGVVGIAKNGVVIFNDQANPPDLIQNEVATFDQYGAHPTDRGQYHYHSEPAVFIPASGPRNELVGIAIDGFPIYGSQNDKGQNVFDAGGSPTKIATNEPNNWTTHETDPTPSGLPHYRAVANNYLATSSGGHHASVVPAGTIVPVFYLIGKYLGGKPGMISQ